MLPGESRWTPFRVSFVFLLHPGTSIHSFIYSFISLSFYSYFGQSHIRMQHTAIVISPITLSYLPHSRWPLFPAATPFSYSCARRSYARSLSLCVFMITVTISRPAFHSSLPCLPALTTFLLRLMPLWPGPWSG